MRFTTGVGLGEGDTVLRGELTGDHFATSSGPIQHRAAHWTFFVVMGYNCAAGWTIIPHQKPPSIDRYGK